MNPKHLICDIGRRIWLRNLCAGNEGNLSIRTPGSRGRPGPGNSGGSGGILCTPTGISKGFMKPNDLITVNLDGKQIGGNSRGRKPTSEIKLHLAIYKHRPDVRAVLHAHPPHATAFAVADIPLPQAIHPEAELFLGRVPLAPYALPSTHALPDSILHYLQPDTSGVNTILLGRHGVVTFSHSLLHAYYQLEVLEAYCRLLLLTAPLGGPRQFSPQQLRELLRIKQQYFGIKDSRAQSPITAKSLARANKPFFKAIGAL